MVTVLVFTFHLSPFTLHGQAVATLSADTIELGGQTELTVHGANRYPSTDQLSQNSIIALSQSFDTARHTQTTVLTCFEPGEHYVMLSSDDSLPLVVLDVEIDTTSAEIRDIAAIESIPYTFWEVFRWILLGLIIIAACAVSWWLYKHRKGLKEVFTIQVPPDTRTPEQRALDNLEQLRRRQLWQGGKSKEYHTELTDIVRQFIEESTGIHAAEMTSDECIEALTQSHNQAITQLKDIFTTADLVKFAKSEPLPYEHDRSMSNAVEFVKTMWASVKPEGKEAHDDA